MEADCVGLVCTLHVLSLCCVCVCLSLSHRSSHLHVTRPSPYHLARSLNSIVCGGWPFWLKAGHPFFVRTCMRHARWVGCRGQPLMAHETAVSLSTLPEAQSALQQQADTHIEGVLLCVFICVIIVGCILQRRCCRGYYTIKLSSGLSVRVPL
jgi:hypothetical protein